MMSEEKSSPLFSTAQRPAQKPLPDWLQELSSEDSKTPGRNLWLVEGWPLGRPLCRSLGDGLRELRCRLTGNRIPRVYFLRGEGADDSSSWLCQRKRRKRRHKKNASAGVESGSRTAEGDRSMRTTEHIGSSREDFLSGEGLYQDATDYAVKRVHLERWLDPDNDRMQLETVQRGGCGCGAAGSAGAGLV
jgi:hypothetical protein